MALKRPFLVSRIYNQPLPFFRKSVIIIIKINVDEKK